MQLARKSAQPIDPATISFSINGKPYFVADRFDMPLLWFLRDELRLTGTKAGCGDNDDCGGICSVLLDGQPVRACRTPLSALVGLQVLTVEGLASQQLHPLQRAFVNADVPQCGYCIPAWLIHGAALLARNPRANAVDVARISVICRCGVQVAARRAILSVAERNGEASR